MSEKKINCGFRELRKNERRGTMKECAEMGKISYYGIKKIDSKTLEMIQKKKNITKDLEKMKVKLVGIKGELKKLKTDISKEKDKKTKKKMETEYKEKEKKFDELLKEYQKMNKEKESKKTKKTKK